MNRRTLQLASAYMSVIIGGGFASGQEVLQFFTSFGPIGIAGTLISGFLFAFLGMQIASIGSTLGAHSHKDVLTNLFGGKVGSIIDLLLIFFLYGVGVVMLAAAGSLFKEHFDYPLIVGGLIMATVVTLTLCLRVQRIVDIISAVTPLLVILVIALAIYAFTRSNADMDTLTALSAELPDRAAPNWLLAGVLYASFNIAVGFPMLAVLSGGNKNVKETRLGGIIGGMGLGLLILILNVSLFSNLNQLQGVQMPTLAMAQNLHPIAGWFMLLALFCMIFSTSVGMFFAFSARFAEPSTNKFKLISLLACFVGLGLSFAGFPKLVGFVYPLLGYLGLAIIIAVIWNWSRSSQR